ncbi:MAG: DNA polymerase III subunit beta [Candidatus Pacebacteria bacterium]|nr:DNA polymerase III subunit beta [Candidatus Paceibacterota bacterium]
MKIETTLEKIKDAVSRIQKVSAKNLSLPILENVLITVKDSVMTLRVTNLHVGTEITVPVKVIKEGEIAVKIDVFSSIINSLGNEHKVILDQQENNLHISTEKSDMNIKLYPHADFPTLPRVEDASELMVDIETLIQGVQSVVYSASLSDIKPEISSVYIYPENNELVFVATDSFRLAEKRIVAKGVNDFGGVIIPVKNIQECLKIFLGISGDVSLKIGKNQLSIDSEDIYFTSRIVDGNYPDYKQIIPNESKTDVVVLKDELIKSLRLVNVFSDNFNQILVKTNSEKGVLDIHSRNTDVGENNTAIDAAITGEGIEMYLNHKYLTDVFSATYTDSIQFSFTEKNKPCIVRSVGDSSFLYLIMPMNR